MHTKKCRRGTQKVLKCVSTLYTYIMQFRKIEKKRRKKDIQKERQVKKERKDKKLSKIRNSKSKFKCKFSKAKTNVRI